MPSSNLQLPHLVSFCDAFELRTNRHCRAVTIASKKWAAQCPYLDHEERQAVAGLQPGLLASLCYPTCDVAQLQFITEVLIVVVHWLDKPHAAGDERFIDQTCTKVSRDWLKTWQPRFRRHLQAFRDARVLVQTDNERAVVPDLESYVPLRQESSCAKILLDMIEYAVGLHIPDTVYADPVLKQLRKNACDIIAWSIDIASVARKQATSDKHNLVLSAVHAAGALVKKTVGAFLENERLLAQAHAFGPCVDADVRRYVRGVRDCIVGLTHWLYETDRFFGEAGDDVRDLGWVFLPSR
ncbi:isoprenoid synthase domain-containing protein [Fomitopsis serialis]|uniref:isoprenoid synthase domain-containing protein n=1 Tax=Fomitopsis serialis TaxID=139415 RepID=UPI002008B6D1|nr:isoprenoid synthase domain-containing protein [Neoantrodia serialis]KAH9920610.1 isoprenoid synthase domain-containing protein [Neoantrodia serialis]